MQILNYDVQHSYLQLSTKQSVDTVLALKVGVVSNNKHTQKIDIIIKGIKK